jgi:hypothetical protein
MGLIQLIGEHNLYKEFSQALAACHVDDVMKA